MKISQREARRLRKRVTDLERREAAQIARYGSEYPGGVNICTLGLGPLPREAGMITAASMMGAAIVAKINGDSLRIYAVLPRRVEQ